MGNGFQGTSLVENALYVMVYCPENSAGQPAPNRHRISDRG
jgi:hypothetical protein